MEGIRMNYNSDVFVTQEAEKTPPPPWYQRLLVFVTIIILFISGVSYCNRRVAGEIVEAGPMSVEALTEDGVDTLRDVYNYTTLAPSDHSARVYRVVDGRMIPVCRDGMLAIQQPIEESPFVLRDYCENGRLTRPGGIAE